jgi:Rha family phage regulatory protein
MLEFNVTVENVNGVLVTTSNRVANELGVRHTHLLDKINGYVNKFSSAELSAQFYITSNYKDKSGKTNKNFLITKKGIAQLVGGYSSAVEKAFSLNVAYINRFEEMEKQLQGIGVPNTFAQALKLAYEQQLKIEQLEIDNKEKETKIIEMSPKASYYDLILQSKDVVAVTVIAKDYGMTAQAFNKLLKENNIQFKCNGTWVLYSKYNGNGYTATKTTKFVHDSGEQGSRVGTYWTQKGRVFLYNFLKEKGVLPMIEKELGEVI